MKRGILILLTAVVLLSAFAVSVILLTSARDSVYAESRPSPGPAAHESAALGPVPHEPAFSGSIVLYIGSPEAIVNGKMARIDDNAAVAPFIENSRTLMPLSFVAKTLGFDVEWREADRAVILKQKELTLEFKLGSNIMKNNGVATEMETAAFARNGRTFVPISYVAKAMGIQVTYDQGLIILDSEKVYSPSADKDYINSLIAQLSGLPIVGSAEKFNTIMKDIAAEQQNMTWGWVDDELIESDMAFSIAFSEPNTAAVPTQPPVAKEMRNIAGDDAGGGGADYSTTNIQVAGVDEADIIKTDGQYIYHLANGTLNIVKADGRGNMQHICSVDLQYKQESFNPQDMYVDGDRLCVIGMDYSFYDNVKSLRYYGSSAVKVLVYDIKQKDTPALLREFSAEGDLLTSRKVDNMLYLVMNHYMYFYGVNRPSEAVPLYYDSAAAKDADPIPMEFSTMRYFPDCSDSSMLIICGLDIADAKAEAKIASIIGSGNTVYMSRSALYVARYNYDHHFFLREIPEGRASNQTTFFKFALDNGHAMYQAKGSADGEVLNQYSMDEHNGFFRAAMTVNTFDGESKNALTIFDQAMQISGSIDNMAPGERIYSARFMGGRAFMVTYRTVDPLFALDLSDPYHPKVLGELKIPGYSTYLHPYGENHLIGFGRDTEELRTIDSKGNVISSRAVNRGLKLALFDVSDMTAPKEISVVSIGNEFAESELLHNPKALLFSQEKGFLAFPVTQYPYKSYERDDEYAPFIGAHVYDISVNGIKLRGTISQANLNNNYYGDWHYSIRRILYIGDSFYSASEAGLQANDMSSLKYTGYIKYGK